MPTSTGQPDVTVTIPRGAWYGEDQLPLAFPARCEVHRLAPQDGPAISEAAIAEALNSPLGSPRLRDLAAGKQSAVIAVDDLTRPTPAWRFLPSLVAEIKAGGIPEDRIRLIMGTASHRPMDPEEMEKKLGRGILDRFKPVMHDFMGPDIRRVGWIRGGPVYLNRHFLEGELRIVVGAVIPHAETGFGGGAKMVVPGLSGHLTIAHFHGALPPREAGQLENAGPALDRRGWAEAVARRIGVHAAVCAVINSRRQLAGLYVGDVVEAHRAAARQARDIGRTPVPRDLAASADVVVASAYPLDTDPVQMGKSLAIGAKIKAPLTVVINGASDGIMYHGMGMGCGIDWLRLARNVPGRLRPRNLGTWLRGMTVAIRQPILAARFCYFTLNPLSYESFRNRVARESGDGSGWIHEDARANPLVLSETIPVRGFRRKHPHGNLYRSWPPLVEEIMRRFGHPRILVFPCAPLQLVDVV